MRRLIILGALLVASVAPSFSYAKVVVTYPFSGQDSDSLSITSSSDRLGFMQPLGNIDQLVGLDITKIVGYVSITKFGASAPQHNAILWNYQNADYSDAPVMECIFKSYRSIPYTGFLDYDDTPCTLLDTGYYILEFQAGVTNYNSFTMQGTGGFYSGQPAMRHAGAGTNSATYWSAGTTDSTVGAVWFQIWADSTSTPTEILLQTATTSTDAAWNDLLTNVGTSDHCVESATSSIVTRGLCTVFTYLFSPRSQTLTDFTDFFGTVSRKPPFGYYRAISDDMSAISTTTAATSSSSYVLAAAAGASAVYGHFFDQWNTYFAMLLWLALGIYIVVRLIKFDFHA